jgi:hypothetical protein
MKKLATGKDVAAALRQVASAIEADEQRGVNPSSTKITNTLIAMIGDIAGSEVEADEALLARFEEGKPADPTENMSESEAKDWRVQNLKNRDNFKEARFESGKPADPTEHMTPDDASKWKAMNEEHGDNFKTAANNAQVSTFLIILSSYLTQQDQKEEKKHPNLYRLGLFLQAKEKVEADVRPYLKRDDAEAMAALKKSLQRNFNPGFPPLNKILKQINEWEVNQKAPKLNKI